MAQIVGGIGVSHTPTIGFAVDRDLEGDPSWSPVFSNLREVRDWIEDRNVDALFVIYNDHVTSFFFDHYSAFALGVDDTYKPADEGGGARDLPPIAGHAEFARHIGHSLMAEEFDLAFFRDRPLDHGCFSPLSLVNMSNRQWIRSHRSIAGRRTAIPDPHRSSLLPARTRLAQSRLELPGRHTRRHRRDRRPFPSSARRAVRFQQSRLGPGVPWPHRDRSRGTDSHDTRGTRFAWRSRIRGDHHVAGHAGSALRQRQEGSAELFPAFNDGHRHLDTGG